MNKDFFLRFGKQLNSMLPAGIVSHSEPISSCPDNLSAEENVVVKDAVDKRKKEFAAGRYCAKKCMNTLGCNTDSIPSAETREPVWPKGFTGSISHTDYTAGCVAAKTSDYKAIGLDIEESGRIQARLWKNLFNSHEAEAIDRHIANAVKHPETILFSAKEAFFKLQFPITSEWLDFLDVEVSLNPKEHTFAVRVLKQDFSSDLSTLSGHYSITCNTITTLTYMKSTGD